MLWARASRMASSFTLTLPRHRKRRKPLSCFISQNEPSAWILRFSRSLHPSSLVIRSKSSLRYSTYFLDTYSVLLRSSSGFLLQFPLIHSFYGRSHHTPGRCIPVSPAHIRFYSAPFLYDWTAVPFHWRMCSCLFPHHMPCSLSDQYPSGTSLFLTAHNSQALWRLSGHFPPDNCNSPSSNSPHPSQPFHIGSTDFPSSPPKMG